jgi:hypothetical protein
MRIQILPLPPHIREETVDDGDRHSRTRYQTTPFVLVIDQLKGFDTLWLTRQEVLEDLRERWGAQTVVVNTLGKTTISPTLELPAELQQQLASHLAKTLKEQQA